MAKLHIDAFDGRPVGPQRQRTNTREKIRENCKTNSITIDKYLSISCARCLRCIRCNGGPNMFDSISGIQTIVRFLLCLRFPFECRVLCHVVCSMYCNSDHVQIAVGFRYVQFSHSNFHCRTAYPSSVLCALCARRPPHFFVVVVVVIDATVRISWRWITIETVLRQSTPVFSSSPRENNSLNKFLCFWLAVGDFRFVTPDRITVE